jgi:hypothetical protein
MPSINQAAAGAGIYDIDSNTLGHIRDIGILENEKNPSNS